MTSAPQHLRGGTPLAELMRRLEADSEMASRLHRARQTLAKSLPSESNPLRGFRLAVGLSQASLAQRVETTQSYLARVEAGTVDPGTDMLVRLAEALGVPVVEIFEAVRVLRGSHHG